MDTRSDFTDAVIVDNGRVVMRVSTNAPTGEMVTYRTKLAGESANSNDRQNPADRRRGRVSRSGIYIGNALLMMELPFGYCDYERQEDQAVNQ